MTQADEASYNRIRDMLMNEYNMSPAREGARFDSLVLRTYKQFVVEYVELKEQERKEQYAETRCTEKETTAKERTS